MKQEIVLPKFTVPGQGPSWVIRVLWGAGALLTVQFAVLGVILWRRGQAPAPAVAPAVNVAAAPAPAAPPASVPPAAPAAPSAAVAAAAAPEVAKAAPSTSVRKAKAKASRSGRRGKLLAKATYAGSGKGRPVAGRKSKSDADLDALLGRLK